MGWDARLVLPEGINWRNLHGPGGEGILQLGTTREMDLIRQRPIEDKWVICDWIYREWFLPTPSVSSCNGSSGSPPGLLSSQLLPVGVQRTAEPKWRNRHYSCTETEKPRRWRKCHSVTKEVRQGSVTESYSPHYHDHVLRRVTS